MLHSIKLEKQKLPVSRAQPLLLLGESRKWDWLSQLHWRGSFKGARAFRSPSCAGVAWSEVDRVITTAIPSGVVLSDISPNADGITEAQACRSFGGSADIIVDVHLIEGGNNCLGSIGRSDLGRYTRSVRRSYCAYCTNQ